MATHHSPQDSAHSPGTASVSSTSKRGRDAASDDGDNGAEPSQPRPKRLQVARACQRCKRLQKGCSEHRPCQRCVRAGLAEQCAAALPYNGGAATLVAGHPVFSPGTVSATRAFVDGFGGASFSRSPPPARVVDLCLHRFFSQLCPTIPILTPDYASTLRLKAESPESEPESYGAIVALCAMILLQVEDQDGRLVDDPVCEKNREYGQSLLDEAQAVHQSITKRSNPSFEHLLLVFFIYACHACLFHHSRAFFFLREATTLSILSGFEIEDPRARPLAERLFWVLLISERSHAIRYQRPVTLQITPSTPPPDRISGLVGFWNLVALFRPLDTSFLALLNHENLACPPSPASLKYIEAAINRAVDHGAELYDTQKANLRVTQLWLRIILWQLRLRLGHLSETAQPLSLTYHYPLEVAKDATLSTRDLPLESIRVHGVGLTEKLFDISCAVVDVLARIPLTQAEKHGIGGRPEDNLFYLRRLITQLPGGLSIYQDLLQKHIQQTLPDMAT